MKLKLKQVALAGAFIVAALPALARDVALVLTNGVYKDYAGASDTQLVDEAVRPLKAAGFQVVLGRNADADNQIVLVNKFLNGMKEADRIVILLTGDIVSGLRDSWLLAADMRKPNMFTVGRGGVSIGAIMEAAAQKPGSAVVMIAKGKEVDTSYGVRGKLGKLTIPHGVVLIKGPMAGLLPVLEGILEPGNSVSEVMGRAPYGVTAEGFLPKATAFIPYAPPPVVPLPVDHEEASYWDAVRAVGTIDALHSYLDRYPNGQFAFEAMQMIEELRLNPVRRAQEAEKRLKLKREQRRRIQRNLSLLGFDPNGVDGVFGRGSRAAIGAWQQSRGFDGHGYLTGNQIAALQAQAEIRARELEEEARLRKQEQDRQDAAYWRQTGRGGTESGLRAYLSRYPDGLYSIIARDRLEQLERDSRNRAAKAERDYWDAVQSDGSAKAYRKYLKKYPRGVFARTAKVRLEQLEGTERDKELIKRAKAEEAKVAGQAVTRVLIEHKLQALGLNPGQVDGVFDKDSRRALRKFQRARQIPVTGYVTQKTIVQLLVTQRDR